MLVFANYFWMPAWYPLQFCCFAVWSGLHWTWCQYWLCTMFVGLLTVNPKERITMQDLLNNEWINGTNLETTPLATPDVLSVTRGSISAVQSQISATLSAFHQARRAGFRLQDVSNAPLVRRRKRMREEGGSSGSTDSSRASTPVPPSTIVLSPLAVSTAMSPLADAPGTAGFQPCTSIITTHSVTSDSLPLPQLATSQSVLPWSQSDDSTASCGAARHNSPLSYSMEMRHSSAAVSSPCPNHSPAHLTDGSSSSRGSTSPVSRTASITSLGFSPAVLAASSSENSCLSSASAAMPAIPSSVSHSDGSGTVGSCLDNGSRKRKLPDNSGHQSYIQSDDDDDDDDDDCVIIGVTEGIMSSSSDGVKKMRALF